MQILIRIPKKIFNIDFFLPSTFAVKKHGFYFWNNVKNCTKGDLGRA